MLFAFIQTVSLSAQDTLPHYELELHYGISINQGLNHLYGAEFRPRISPVLFGINYSKFFTEKSGWGIEVDYVHKGVQNYVIDYMVFSILYTRRFNGIFRKAFIGPYYGKMFSYKKNGVVLSSPTLKYYDYGIECGFHLSIPVLYKKYGLSISPRTELGMLRFSNSYHFVGQIKLSWEIR